MVTNKQIAEFAALVEKAQAAGMAAGEAAKCTPMHLVGGAPGGEQKHYVVEDGPCGFAWITFFPGNCPLANYLKKRGIAKKAYGGGVSRWVSEFDQSITRKEAFASAYAKVFQEAGHKAYSGSRLD